MMTVTTTTIKEYVVPARRKLYLDDALFAVFWLGLVALASIYIWLRNRWHG